MTGVGIILVVGDGLRQEAMMEVVPLVWSKVAVVPTPPPVLVTTLHNITRIFLEILLGKYYETSDFVNSVTKIVLSVS